MVTWFAVGLAEGVGFALGVVDAASGRWPSAATLAVLPGAAGDANNVLLAGTSSRNEAKIWSSSGCVHRTFAVSPGTTSPRGKFGMVKKAILPDGMPRSDSPRL